MSVTANVLFRNSPNLIELYMLSYRARNIRKSSMLVNAAQAESDAFCDEFGALCD